MPRYATELQDAYLAQPAAAEAYPALDSCGGLRVIEETEQRFRFSRSYPPQQRWTYLRAIGEQRIAQRLLILRRQLCPTLGQPPPDLLQRDVAV